MNHPKLSRCCCCCCCFSFNRPRTRKVILSPSMRGCSWSNLSSESLKFGMWRVFWYLWLLKKPIENMVISSSKLYMTCFFGLSFWRLCILYVYIYDHIRIPYTETWAKLGIRPLHAHGQSTIYDPQAKPRENHPGQGDVFFSIGGDAWKCETNKLDFFLKGDEIKDNSPVFPI